MRRAPDVVAGAGAPPDDFLVAYFSAEFGLDESLPIYSGGLGILAGDHLKSASELGVPLVGDRPHLLPRLLPPAARRGRPAGRALSAQRQRAGCRSTLVPMAPEVVLADDDGRLVPVRIGVWRAQVGRVSLYLLDTKIEGNPDWARDVTDTLYGGDRSNRLRQELVLGIGGVRVLRRLGLAPTVFHMNEGHSAFLQLERLRELVEEEGVDRDDALERLRGLDRLHDAHAGAGRKRGVRLRARAAATSGALVERCGFAWAEFAELGKVDARRHELRAHAVRAADVGATRTASPSCTARCRARCGTRSGPIGRSTRCRSRRSRTACTPARGSAASSRSMLGCVGAEAPARARARRRGALDGAPRREARGCSSSSRGHAARRGLDPDALTIGFARRFATYKRAGLLFGQPERLARLLGDPDRPVQILARGQGAPRRRGRQGRHPAAWSTSRATPGAGRMSSSSRTTR